MKRHGVVVVKDKNTIVIEDSFKLLPQQLDYIAHKKPKINHLLDDQ